MATINDTKTKYINTAKQANGFYHFPTSQEVASNWGVELNGMAGVYAYVHLREDYQNMDEADRWMLQFGEQLGPHYNDPRDDMEVMMYEARKLGAMIDQYFYDIACEIEAGINHNIKIEQESAKCGRCDGKGYLPQYYYWRNGECFKCGGTGLKAGYDLLRADQ